MGAFLRFVSWVAKYGSKAIKAAWKYRKKIIEWLNIGQAFDWIWNKIKSWF